MTINRMIQELCEMRRGSDIAGDPAHLYTYYHDAIQAMQRLSVQLNNVDRMRDNSAS